jgi:hypothetical protein
MLRVDLCMAPRIPSLRWFPGQRLPEDSPEMDIPSGYCPQTVHSAAYSKYRFHDLLRGSLFRVIDRLMLTFPGTGFPISTPRPNYSHFSSDITSLSNAINLRKVSNAGSSGSFAYIGRTALSMSFWISLILPKGFVVNHLEIVGSIQEMAYG